MIVQNFTPVTATQTSQSAGSSIGSVLPVSGRERIVDSVQISPEARRAQAGQAARLAVSSPAALITNEQIQIKMSLVRTLMEALFGQKVSSDATPEQELVQTVAEPINQQVLQKVTDTYTQPVAGLSLDRLA